MYDRAPRVLAATAPLCRTSSGVGPGTYAVPDPSKFKTFGYAPFLSLAKRESFLTMSEEVAITPAPGHYDIDKNILDKVKGGKSIQNRSRRFSVPVSSTPGPGTYHLAPTIMKKKRCHSTPAAEKTSSGRNKTFVSGRISYKRQETAPSIPFPGKSYGYEEDETTGRLKPQKFPEHDTSLGPAYYSVKNDSPSTMTTKKYKGVHFGSLKSKRTQFRGRDGPGPSDYEPKLPFQGASVAMQRADARLLRYHEIVPQNEEKKGIPGPGKYYLASQFEQTLDDNIGPEALVEPPPFGSSQQRFVTSATFTPPATKYIDPRTALETLKRVNGMTKSPFGQTAARFKTDRNAKEIPGPGAYNNEGFATMAGNSKKQSDDVSASSGAFGTTSVRTAPMIRKDESYLPGPAHYQGSSDATKDKPSSMFLSTSKRLYSPPPIVTTIPPPGSYNVANSYKLSQGKVDVKTETPNSAFLSSNSRFAPPRDVQLNETDITNPGPGEYEYQDKGRIGAERGGLICSHDTRFKSKPKTALGPGAYKLSKPLQDTVLKGTYNRTLNNPLKGEEEIRTGGGRFNVKETIIISNE